MKKIKIGLVDDQNLFLNGLRYIIQTFDNIEIVLEASNGQDLLDKIETKKPDVVLLDLKMPVMDGIETTKILKQKYPDLKVIFLTMYDDERLISHVMELGANGYLLKDEDINAVKEAITAVVEKGFYFNDYVSKALLKQVKKKTVSSESLSVFRYQGIKLSPRELEVLSLICQEYSTNEIGQKLFISSRTVEGHRKNLLEKTGVKNIAGLVIFALKHNLVQLDQLANSSRI